jgi:acetyl esterase/lipase
MSLFFDTIILEDIPYRTVDGKVLLLDMVRPDPLPSHALPVVIYLFGSGWGENRRKDKEQNPAQFLVAHMGVCVVSIDYRLSSQALFPAQIADARAAVRWLHAHAELYHLDPAHIGVWGYSAGGHLASLLGTAADEPSFDDDSDFSSLPCRVQAVFTVSNPVDFLQMGTWHNDPDSAESRLIGGPIQENVELVRRANPITYIRANRYLPPFHLTHGDQDEVVLIEQSQLLYQALVAAGGDATFLTLAGAGHELGRSTPYWDTINQAALAFFQKHLQG